MMSLSKYATSLLLPQLWQRNISSKLKADAFLAKECPAFKYKWVRFSANLSAHNDDDDGYVDGDDDDDYDDDDDDDEDGQSQAGPFLGQFVRPRLRAGLSCCGNDGSFDVSGLVPRASHTFVRKKNKKNLNGPRN